MLKKYKLIQDDFRNDYFDTERDDMMK